MTELSKHGLCALMLLASLAIAGCAAKSKPKVDLAGVDTAQYEQDLAECEQIERSSRPRAGERILGGAAMSSAEKTDSDDVIELEDCLRDRGYSLLD